MLNFCSSSPEPVGNYVDRVQIGAECCGFADPNDWKDSVWWDYGASQQAAPHSCCKVGGRLANNQSKLRAIKGWSLLLVPLRSASFGSAAPVLERLTPFSAPEPLSRTRLREPRGDNRIDILNFH